MKIIAFIVVAILITCVASASSSNKSSAQKSSANKGSSASKVRKFEPPEKYGFESMLQFLLKLMSIQGSHDDYPYPISVNAQADGTIDVEVNGLVGSANYLKSEYPEVYKHYFGDLNPLGAKHLQFQFHEPDCYLYKCDRSILDKDVANWTPDAYVSSYNKYANGNVYFIILFNYADFKHSSDESFEHYLDRVKGFESMMKNVWYR